MCLSKFLLFVKSLRNSICYFIIVNKLIPLLLIGMIVNTSCSKFYAVTIAGKEQSTILNNSVFENDSLKIEFYFSDNNFTPQFQYKIVNKLAVPIFIDWKNTIVTFDNIVTNYEGNNSIIDANSTSIIRNTQNISGVVQNISKPNIVPPNSFLLSERLYFFSGVYGNTTDFAKVKEKEIQPNKYVLLYNETTTPKVLSFYLSTKIGNMNGVNRFYDFKFWINKVMLINKTAHQSSTGGNSDLSTYVSKIVY